MDLSKANENFLEWNHLFLDAMNKIHDSQEEVKISTLTGVWKKLISTLIDDPEGFKPWVEEVTTDVMKIAREPELEAGPKDVTELHHLMIKL